MRIRIYLPESTVEFIPVKRFPYDPVTYMSELKSILYPLILSSQFSTR